MDDILGDPFRRWQSQKSMVSRRLFKLVYDEGYLTNEEGREVGYKGELLTIPSDREARKVGLDMIVQFCLERACINEEELCMVIDDKLGLVNGCENIGVAMVKSREQVIKVLGLELKYNMSL
ncbi:hypothetical protein PIB30_065987 [Stylosanthes scabra]|uniref:Uncharacterized protein n=1 Tax=Stylosanthes scabra TaxID=79078 RepID=A0ABU6QN91_9FABA|nr:hypothetical protein [Stylosanthes scabra]